MSSHSKQKKAKAVNASFNIYIIYRVNFKLKRG